MTESADQIRIIARASRNGVSRSRAALDLKQVYVAPRDHSEESLAGIWQDVLGLDEIGVEDDFFELGGSSLQAVEAFLRMEEAFGRRLPLAVMAENATVRHLAALLGASGRIESWRSLVAFRAEGSKPPFFCVHDLSGTVLGYRVLARLLSQDQPFYGLQYPGQDQVPIPRLSAQEMTTHYVDEIRRVQPSGPYFLGGYSLGAMLAYLMALELERRGEEVAILISFDGITPRYPPPPVARKLYHAIEFLHRPLRSWPDYLRNRVGSMLFRYLRGRARKRAVQQLAKEEIYGRAKENDLFARLSQLRQGDLSSAKLGQLESTYRGRTVLFRCAENIANWRRVPDLGWGELVKGELEIVGIQASHETLMAEPAISTVARHLQASLNAAQAQVATDRGG